MKADKQQCSHPLASVLASVVRVHAVLTILLALAIAVSVAASLLPPLALGAIIDSLTAGSGERILQLAFIYLGFIGFEGVSTSAREAVIVRFGQKVTHSLRSRMAAKLDVLPSSYFASHAAGELTSRFVNDVNTVESLIADGIVSMVADVASIVAIVAVVFTESLGLGLLLAITLPLLFWYTRRVQRGMLGAQVDNRAAVAEANRQIPETLASFRTIRVLGCQGFMRRRYSRAVDRGFNAMERSNFYDAVYSPVILTVSALVVAVMMVLSANGGTLQALFGMTVGTAVANIAYVGKVFTPLSNIGMEIENIQQAVAGIRRIDEFLTSPEIPAAERPQPGSPAASAAAPVRAASADLPENHHPQPVPASHSPHLPAQTPEVELSHVSFSYEEGRPVIRDLSLSVAPGEQVTIAGRTGSGKSTLMKLMLGLYQPDSGTVRVLGQAPNRIPAAQRRRVFGYVEQRFWRIPGNVIDQVTLRDPSVSEADALRALETVGLAPAVSRLPHGAHTLCTPRTFSQGQFQLLAIARAIASDPAVLLLDEITADLDSLTEQQILSALRNASSGRTVISISHRLTEAVSTRIIRIDKRPNR
ncbi:MAG: ABC transporter ATP-binding protein [Coriobacteriales bacterium]|nr:ABC transporter ATP-binding protein [Coriobacteriales bacterium]